MYYYKSAVLSHSKIGGFVSLSKSAILSRFQNRLFCPTLKSAVLSRIQYFRSLNIGCSENVSLKYSTSFFRNTFSCFYENYFYSAPALILQEDTNGKNLHVLLKNQLCCRKWKRYQQTIYGKKYEEEVEAFGGEKTSFLSSSNPIVACSLRSIGTVYFENSKTSVRASSNPNTPRLYIPKQMKSAFSANCEVIENQLTTFFYLLFSYFRYN